MIPTINIEKTGMRINTLIKESGYSVHDISEKLDFATPCAIYQWMDGTYLPKLSHLVALAAILGVSIDDILVIE